MLCAVVGYRITSLVSHSVSERGVEQFVQDFSFCHSNSIKEDKALAQLSSVLLNSSDYSVSLSCERPLVSLEALSRSSTPNNNSLSFRF
jgi:hypothetical protein